VGDLALDFFHDNQTLADARRLEKWSPGREPPLELANRHRILASWHLALRGVQTTDKESQATGSGKSAGEVVSPA
jgi:hypothetical protein